MQSFYNTVHAFRHSLCLLLRNISLFWRFIYNDKFSYHYLNIFSYISFNFRSDLPFCACFNELPIMSVLAERIWDVYTIQVQKKEAKHQIIALFPTATCQKYALNPCINCQLCWNYLFIINYKSIKRHCPSYHTWWFYHFVHVLYFLLMAHLIPKLAVYPIIIKWLISLKQIIFFSYSNFF